MKLRTIRSAKTLKGKKVLLRVDFNVPIRNGRVADDFRIKKALPTIQLLKKKGARVILISHIGRSADDTLLPVSKRLQKDVPHVFAPLAEARERTAGLRDGDVLLLENLRQDEREASNASSFAKELACLADLYVNDAFSASHRKQASVVGVPKYLPSYAGLQMVEEVANLSKAFSPKHPFVVILGGAKFETKLPLIKKFLKTADTVAVAGALINEFYEESGLEMGTSLTDPKSFHLSSLERKKNLLLPKDVTLAIGKEARVSAPEDVREGEMVADIGPASLAAIAERVREAKMILWNGPTGNYENGFDVMTKKLLREVAKAEGFSIIGGGDTVALVSKTKTEGSFGFVSTGGGAMLEFLAKGTLPGIKPLLEKE